MPYYKKEEESDNLLSNYNEDDLLNSKETEPLNEDICTLSIGIPIMFILTYKDDEERIVNYIEEQSKFSMTYTTFSSFISKHVRKLALKYGAGVMFSSIQLSKHYNQEMIFEYFNHILYGFTINKEA